MQNTSSQDETKENVHFFLTSDKIIRNKIQSKLIKTRVAIIFNVVI